LQSANDENEILEEDEVTYDKFAQVALLVVLLVCSLHFANLRIGLFGCEVLVLLLLLPCAWLAGFCVFQ
jgi:hypothetical protein